MSIVKIDLAKAKEMHKQRIRHARAPLFADLDVQFQRAMETSADTSAIVAKKQELRDATATTAINNATNEDELKAEWNTTLLGESPYR
tara:strand:+ start:692 stop:955 length:264 start_codon:yes stop_codon:yes gene_type:complete